MALTTSLMTALVMMTLVLSSVGAWKKDIKVRYFSSAVLRCHENLTVLPDTSNVFWITPESLVLTEVTPSHIFPPHMQLVNGLITMLNISQINEDLFGYYTCVMVKADGQVRVALWGLNVEGADFSHLEEEYRKNAVVGAIAAAVMIVLLGGACLVWHFHFSVRAGHEQRNGCVENNEKAACASVSSSATANVFYNRGYDEPLSKAEATEVSSDLKDASLGSQADAQEDGGALSCKM